MSEAPIDYQPPRILCFWPGLAGLWLKGQWSSLVLAAGFSLLLNFALLSTFVWPGIFQRQWNVAIWAIVVACWLVFGWISRNLASRAQVNDSPDDTWDDTLFNQAQDEYLKGEMTQAGLILAQLLQDRPRDAEARLLLATIRRRSGKYPDAQYHLDQLQKLDAGQHWRFEIQQEQRRIDEAFEELDQSTQNSTRLEPSSKPLVKEDQSPAQKAVSTLRLGEAAAEEIGESDHKDTTNKSTQTTQTRITPEQTTSPSRAA